MAYNWSEFTRKAYIKATLTQVFDAWVKPNEIVTWFIKDAKYTSPEGISRPDNEYPQAGDDYYWKWHQNMDTQGKVLVVEPDVRFQFTFGKKETNSEEYVIVTIDFTKENNETVYTLRQDNMGGPDLTKAEYHFSCNMGWSFFMTNMKAVLEHGIDLRELDEKRAYETRAMSL